MRGNTPYSLFIMLLLAMTGSFSSLQAQEKWEEGGEIESVEIEIVKERQITLPKASRNFEKIPPRPAEPIIPEMTYDFKNFRFNTPDFQPTIRPLRLKAEELQKINGGYLSAGFGNFASPFLAASLTSKRNESRYYGADFLHRSFGKGPVGGANSANGNTQVNLFTKGFNKVMAAGLQAGYENIATHFYGYQPASQEVKRDTLRQMYHMVSVGGQIENVKPGDFNFRLGGNFSYLDDYYRAAESVAGIDFNSDYLISENKFLLMEGSYRLLARKDSLAEAKPRSLLRLAPAFRFNPVEKLTLTAGLLFAYENDTIGEGSDLHLYPNVSASYQLGKTVQAFAHLKGDMEEVSLHRLARENNWVNANLDIFHSNKQLDFSAGLVGRVGTSLSFQLGGAVASYQHLYFYINHAEHTEKFDVVYDNTTRTTAFAEWGVERTNRASLKMRGEYYGYSMDTQAEAWHRPVYRVAAYSWFNLFSKIQLHANVVALGGMKAWNESLTRTETLDMAIDLNVKARYFVSKDFSCFVEGSNLLNSNYPLYFQYPVRGLQVTGGISWSF